MAQRVQVRKSTNDEGNRLLRVASRSSGSAAGQAVPRSRGPRLQHSDGESTWVLVADASRRALSTRVGFEDSVVLPNGRCASSNAELVATAVSLQSEIQGVADSAAGRTQLSSPPRPATSRGRTSVCLAPGAGAAPL